MRESSSQNAPSRHQHSSVECSPELCLAHSLPFQFTCHHCQCKPLCTLCLTAHPSPSHVPISLERSRAGLVNQCEQWRIRLTSKSDLLEIVHDQLQSYKAEATTGSRQYIEAINEWVEETVNLLRDKASELIAAVENSTQEYLRITSQHMQDIRARRQQFQYFVVPLQRAKLDHAPTSRLAHLYFLQHAEITQLLDQKQLDHYKKQLFLPNFAILPETITQLRSSIQHIKLAQTSPSLNPSSTSIHPTISKKKSKKVIKTTNLSTGPFGNDSGVVTPFVAVSTPKNQSREKTGKMLRSPESGVGRKGRKSSAKMMSMPASPAKHSEKSMGVNMEASHRRLFKKK